MDILSHLETAAVIGISPLAFWELTPGELSAQIRAYNRARKESYEEQLVVAYMTAYWHRVKRMPKLSEILGKEETKKKQTPESMLEEIKKLNAAMGGSVY